MHKGRFLLILAGIALTHFAMAQNVGIGTNTPTQKLDIDGQIRIRGGAPGVGKVLTSAADGTASWATPSSGSNWPLLNGNVYRLFGSVGIGITTPIRTLHLHSGGFSTEMLISNDASMNSGAGSLAIGMAYEAADQANSFNYIRGRENIATRFYTNDVQRMTIAANGNVGIGGLFEPTALLHVRGTGEGEGNVLFTGQVSGTPGDPPASGPGTRMMWYPDKAALRAGEVFGNEWNGNVIGNHSMALGYNVKASGAQSVALGLNSSAEGIASLAIGFNASATGSYARSIGNLTIASGNIATAMGTGTRAPSFAEFVIGRLNTEYTPLNTTNWNNADRLFVVGNGVDDNNRSDAMVIMKHGGIGLGISNPAGFSNLHLHNKNADQVFQRFTNSVTGTDITDGLRIGIRDNTHTGQIWNFENGKLAFGTNNVERMTISNIGNVGIGTITPAALLHVDGNGTGGGNVVFTGTKKNSNYGNTPISGSGTRMMWYPDKAAFRAGGVDATNWDLENTGDYSIGLGYNPNASGFCATSIGIETISSGSASFALGQESIASANYAVAMGRSNTASNLGAVAIGQFNVASGVASLATNIKTVANAYYSTAMGSYNVGGGNSNSWVSTDPLFVIGNGTSDNFRANAFTVLKNSRTGINTPTPNAQLHINAPADENGLRVVIAGATRLLASSTGGLSIGTATAPPTNGLRVTGESSFQQNVNIGSTAAPINTLHVRHANVAAGTDPIHGLRIQHTGANNHHWTLYTVNSNGVLALFSSTGGNTSVGNFNAGTGAYTATSNRHLKTNVQLLDADVLSRIQQLTPSSYSYLRDPLQQRTIGFMAEDVQPIFPELVDTIGENGENLAINYAGFSVVAIKAIQLLQEKLDEKEKRIETLEAEMKEIKNWMMGKQ